MSYGPWLRRLAGSLKGVASGWLSANNPYEQLLAAPYLQHLPACRRVDIHPAGDLVLGVWGDQLGVREAETGRRVVEDLSLEEGLLSARFAGDGERVLVGTRQEVTLAVDWRRAAVVARTPKLGDCVDQVRWLPGSQPRFVAVSRSNELSIYDGTTLTRLRQLLGPASPYEPFAGLDVSPDGGRAYLASGQRVRCLDIAAGGELWERGLEQPPEGLAVAPDGLSLAVASRQGMSLLDSATGAPGVSASCFPFPGIHFPDPAGPRWWSPRPAFSPDGRHLAVNTPNGHLMLLDPLSLEVRRLFPRGDNLAWIEDLAWFADSTRLLLGCAHDRLLVWSLDGDRSLLDVPVSR
jgi:WD40 repeat protein